MLDAHATMLARGKTPSDDLEMAFRSFLIEVETLLATTIG